MILLGTPLKLLMPGQPILLALTFAVTLYLVLYEVWHAVLHLPFERFWQPFLNSRPTRKLAKHMYSFHLMHHWRPSSNLAIVGFWGVAVWDHAFLTHRRPERIPLHGAEVNYHDAKLKKPLWPVALLDRWQGGLYRASRATERFLARVFLRRTT
jgi:hemolysin III